MNRLHNQSAFLFICLVFLASSCASVKKIAYLQDSPNNETADSIQKKMEYPRIKPNDKLFISVNAPGSDAAVSSFNLPLIPQKPSYNESSPIQLSNNSIQNFIVDQSGEINMPSIGTIKVSGLTRFEVEKKIESLIYPKYLTEKPLVSVRLTNFTVSILGEVASPGVINIESDRYSIFDALAFAKDITIYGNRKNVLLVREDENGVKKKVSLDLTSADLMNSPYYYLQQNDMIFIQPNQTRANASKVGAAESLTVSIVGTLISLTSLIVTIALAR